MSNYLRVQVMAEDGQGYDGETAEDHADRLLGHVSDMAYGHSRTFHDLPGASSRTTFGDGVAAYESGRLADELLVAERFARAVVDGLAHWDALVYVAVWDDERGEVSRVRGRLRTFEQLDAAGYGSAYV